MADKKISQLTTLAQADVAVTADFLPIVDTSATETKKATPQALVQAGATGATLPVALGAVGTPSYTFTGDLNTGLWSPAADTLAASTGGSERMRLDSSGNLGIGTASPGYKLDVSGTSRFSATVGVGSAVPSASGAGITFPATQSASTDPNTLDDYEEGTFTPTLVGTGSNPTVTYVEQLGSYTKIGNVVHFRVRLVVSAASGGSGDLRVGSLPFTAASIAPPGISNVQFTSSFVANPTVAGVVISTAQISLWTNVTGTSLAVSDLTGGSFDKFLNIAGTYFV